MNSKITLQETVEVETTLMVTNEEHGINRPATSEDLERASFLHRTYMYHRIEVFMDRVGLDPHGEHSLLRAFIEDACGSNGIKVWEASDWESIRDSYYELLKDVSDD